MGVNKKKYLLKQRIDKVLLYLGIIVSVAILIHSGFNTDHSQELLFERLCGYVFTAYTFLLGTKLLLSVGEKNFTRISGYSELLLFLYFCTVSLLNTTGNCHIVPAEWMYVGFFGVTII